MSTPDLDRFLTLSRPTLRRDLARYLEAASGPQSLAVVGLPGFRAVESLHDSLNALSFRQNLIRYDVKVRRARTPARILAELLSKLDHTASTADSSLADLITRFREAGEKLPKGQQLLLVIEDFHELITLRQQSPQDLLDLLDCWQAACTEGGWLSVATSSYLLPARVCDNAGWSEFHKVFGMRIFPAGLLEVGWEVQAKEILAESGLQVSDPVLEELSRVSGGIPDFVLELLRHVMCGPVAPRDMERFADDSPYFEELRGKMLRALRPEVRAFFESAGWKHTTNQTRQASRECVYLGLLIQKLGQFEFSSPLLHPPQDEISAPPSASFLHGQYLLADEHVSLVRKLFADTHYTNLETLQNLPNEAHVLRATREDDRGRMLPPRIVKIWDKARLEKERQNHGRAQNLLGAACPQLLGFETQGSHAAMLIQFASADSRCFEAHTFAQLLEAHANKMNVGTLTRHGLPDPVEVIERLLNRVLAALYRGAKLESHALSKHYHVPAVRRKGDEFTLLTELAGRSGYLDTSNAALVFGANVEPLAEPGQLLHERDQELFQTPWPTLTCDPVHRDLNARNFLIDGAGNIHVIDFASLSKGPLCLDFTRLECEVLLKLTPVENLGVLVRHCCELLDGDPVVAADKVVASGATGSLATTFRVIASLRRIVRNFATEAKPGKDYSFETDYTGGLAANAGRIALFTD